MYAESDYFDAHDHTLDGASQTAHNNSLEENLRLSNFSIEELGNNPAHEEIPTAGMGIDLQDQLGFDLEQEYNSQLMESALQHSHPSQLMSNWDSNGVHEMNDNMSVNINDSNLFHHQQQNDQIALQQHNLRLLSLNSPSQYAAPPYPAPDLLNLLHLPRCSMSSVLQPTPSISFNSLKRKSANFHTLDIFGEFPANDGTSGSTVLYDPPLQLNFPPQPPVFRDLFHSLPPHNYGLQGPQGSLFGGVDERDGNGSGNNGSTVIQEGENSVLDFRREIGGLGRGRMRGTNHFATERQRRDQLNLKFSALRLLVPNPTKVDRASVVADGIEYIKELLRSVDDLKILVDKKRCGRERSKRIKSEEEATPDMENPSMKPNDREHSNNGSLRSSWLLRKSKETVVDVRIIDDEVNIKLTQRKKMNCLLLVTKVLDELQLNLLQLSGGNIGDYYIFMFNTKISEGSSVYASAIAKKLIDVLDRQHPAFPSRL